MEPAARESASSNKNATIIIFASMAAIYGLTCLCFGIFLFIFLQQSRSTSTPPVHKPANTDLILKDDFSNNLHSWHSDDINGAASVENGHLFIESLKTGRMLGAQCGVCSFAQHRFYIEADFSTNKAIDTSYGIVFNLKNDYEDAYSFEINPLKKRYNLYKVEKSSSNGYWMLRLSNINSIIKPYPEINKLGVFFEKDTIELYINGTMVDRYEDPGTRLDNGAFGFHTDNAGFELIVDNLFAYGK